MTELERMKNVIKKICTKNDKNIMYPILCEILDYIRTHENMISETRDNNVKSIIERSEDI